MITVTITTTHSLTLPADAWSSRLSVDGTPQAVADFIDQERPSTVAWEVRGDPANITGTRWEVSAR